MKKAKLISYSDELYHHGIKGMKWGVKNGPPYPLDDSDHSASEKKAGWRKSLDKSESDKQNKDEKHGLTDKQKKAIKIGVAVAATALVAIGTYKLADSGELHRLIEKGKAALGKTDDIGFKRNPDLAKPMSAEEIANTFFGKINPGFGEEWGTTKNCKRCTYAYELSRRGYNVKATRTLDGTGQTGFVGDKIIGKERGISFKNIKRTVNEFVNSEQTDDDVKKALLSIFKETDIELTPKRSENYIEPSKKIFQSLSKMPNGARGELTCKWLRGGSHSMAWEIVDNEPIIFDMQTNEMFKDPDSFNNLAYRMRKAAFSRLDNQELNLDLLRRWVTNDA